MVFFKKIKQLFSSRFLIRHKLSHFVRSEVQNMKFRTVIDVGGGKTPYRKFIKYDKYLILDIEDKKGTGEVIICDLNKKIDLPKERADLVIMTEVLEHIKNPQNAINEVYRILKPNSKLLLTTPMIWPIHSAPNDFFRHTKHGLELLLKNAGFSKFKINPSNSYLYTLFQLLNIPLRKKFFRPIVFVFNVLGLFCDKFSKRSNSLPLSWQVVVYK